MPVSLRKLPTEFHTSDTNWTQRNGQTVRVLRPLSPADCDMAEVGPMFVAQFSDGVQVEAFRDELVSV